MGIYLFDTLIVFLKEVSSLDFEKKQTSFKHETFPRGQIVKNSELKNIYCIIMHCLL